MTYDFDEDNSWLDALVTEEAAASDHSSAKSTKGRKGCWVMAPRVGQKISAVKKSKQRVQSPETRAKISAANKGRKATPETRAKISAAHKGKKRTAEHRAKISAAQKGKKHTPETRALFRIVNAGRKISPEHRAKIVASVSQPIVLPVGGQFDSIRKANDWLLSQGVGNGLKKITKWLKTHPDQVYYLPKDTK